VVTSHAREPLHLDMMNTAGNGEFARKNEDFTTGHDDFTEKVIEPAKIKTTRWIHVLNSKTG